MAQLELAQLEPASEESHAVQSAQPVEASSAGSPVSVIDGEEEFMDLIPAYLDGELTDARSLLFEEESRRSVTLRRALRDARDARRSGVAASDRRHDGPSEADPTEPSDTRLRFLAAAAVVLAAGLSVFFFASDLVPMPQGATATVEHIDGTLFKVADDALEPLEAGTVLSGSDLVRTAKGSRARLLLDDGSRVELDERASLRVMRRLRGQRILVDRGQIIVQASEQGSGSLRVGTEDLMVAVKGTIFNVSQGTKGSRVSVIEGEVLVRHAAGRSSLFAGQQLGTPASLAQRPVQEQVAWSADADRYIAMLTELSQLRRDIDALMTTSPRYSTRLLDLSPADAAIYVAVPNATAKLAEVYDLVTERMADNPQLAEFWQAYSESEASSEVDTFVAWLREVSDYLGDETVVTVGHGVFGQEGAGAIVDGDDGYFLALSEVGDRNALYVALEEKIAELETLVAEHGPDGDVADIGEVVSMVDDPANATAGGVSIWIGDDLVAITNSPRALADAAAAVAAGQSSFVGSDFHQQLAKSYTEGAQFLAAVDIASFIRAALSEDDNGEGARALAAAGFDNATHLIVERRSNGTRAQTVVSLNFDGPRHGVVNWLDEPAPMGALEFFSPDATVVTAVLLRDPRELADEILAYAEGEGSSPQEALVQFYEQTGLDLIENVLAPLGGEFAAGLDGPALPVPSWKTVIEVYDEPTFQHSIEQIVARAQDTIAEAGEDYSIVLTETQAGGRTFYSLEADTPEGNPVAAFQRMMEVHYTYVDGYMVAAPSQILVERAIQYQEAGASLINSQAFRELLPSDDYVDFSGLVFNRLGELLGEFSHMIPGADNLNQEQQLALDNLRSESGPALYCLYGDEDAVRFVSHGAAQLPLGGISGMLGLGSVVNDIRSSIPISNVSWGGVAAHAGVAGP